MKKIKTFGIVALVATIITLAVNRPVKAQPAKAGHEAEIIYIGEFDDSGLQVYLSSSSAGAPKFPQYPSAVPLTQAADAIVQLMNEGFTPIQINANGQIQTWTK